MRTFVSFLFVVILLVPSSLGAVVAVAEQCQTLASKAEVSCCCTHEEPSRESGPYLERSCCCEVKTPPAPMQEPILPRDLAEGAPDYGVAPFLEHVEKDYEPGACSLQLPRFRGPPRAPPRPLFLQHQRFLI